MCTHVQLHVYSTGAGSSLGFDENESLTSLLYKRVYVYTHTHILPSLSLEMPCDLPGEVNFS